MHDITASMLRYREAARNVWNCFLREECGGAPGDHDWEALKQVLFTALVLRRCGHDDCAAALLGPSRYGFSWVEPIAHIRVKPSTEVPVMISRTPGCCGYWDFPVDRLGPDDADLGFIDFFDFDQAGFVDFKYYWVRIDSCARHPALAGHHALIEVSYAKVVASPCHEPTPSTAG